MLTGVARMNWAARSSQWKSGRLRIISSTRSPTATRSTSKPCAACAARPRTSDAVQTCQSSPLRACSTGASGLAAASSRNRRGTVTPATRALTSSIVDRLIVPSLARGAAGRERPKCPKAEWAPVTSAPTCGCTLCRVRSAVIVDAVRTPLGKRNGRLRDWHPVDLAAELLNAVRDRNGLDPVIVDDVVLGCVMQVGEQAANVARNAVLAAG